MTPHPLRVLLVEDNVDDAALLLRLLKEGHYDPVWERVDSPASLQAALTRQTWDIVISDFAMPQFDGLTALQIVRAHDALLPFLLVSGTVGEDIAVGAMRAGANDYVMKDKPTRLLPAIARELHEAAAHRKQQAAQQALAESEERFRSFMRHFPGLAYVKDAAGRALFVNKGFATYLGMDPATLLGKTNHDLFPADFADKLTRDDQQVLTSGQSMDIEEHFAGRTWSTYKFPIGPDGGTKLLAGFTLDISAHKQAEGAIREGARRWQNTFDAVHDAILILDTEQHILQGNRAAEVLLGKTATDMLNRPCWEVIHDRLEPPGECPVQKMRTSMRHESVEMEFASKYWVVEADPILDEHGKLAGVVHTIRDMTEYKQLQTQLAQAQKMESIGQLAGGVAHDFNNLLQALMGYAELLLGQTPASDERHADLLEIHKTGQRAADLTRQLLAFARKQTVAPKVLDLNESIEGLLKMLRRLIGEHIELVWTPGSKLWPIWMDPAQLDQILANLLVNARDAITGQGRITLATDIQTMDADACSRFVEATPGDYVLLSVFDTGCGMTPEIQARIFEPFFTTKGVGQGTGLGLATVYGIIKQNHGFITVQSAPGKGTAFHLFLPRHTGAAEPIGQRITALPQGRGETILLVEDEVAILKLSRRLLERLGYTVLMAPTPRAALALAERPSSALHLLVTDVVMPEISGRELSQRLHTRHPALKTLFMSGYTADIIARQGVLEAGVNFIQKPFTTEDLARKVRQVLDAP